ncbi:MAG: ABC transporter permease [Bacteroidetes bacterium]|nr:MAG: ABC transporter permease [Bacteroidota bacterium]
MERSYNQITAMLAITKGALKAILRSPSAVVFSIAFPLIFILVFGFLGSGGSFSLKIAFSPKSDTLNALYAGINMVNEIKIVRKPEAEIQDDLTKGRLLAVLDIQPQADSNAKAKYAVNIKSSDASDKQRLPLLKLILQSIISGVEQQQADVQSFAAINNQIEEVKGRKYRNIDFILPGQLGFSLLSSGVFGVAFLFFNLRQTLVLKRFYATPIRRGYIVLGEGLARVIFQMMTAVIIIGLGYFAFSFTLVNGWVTFLEIMVLSFLALLVSMGFGFIVSSLAPNESSIPPFANLITLPQFLLAGTFFSIDAFPQWLQPLCRILPLTYFNDAMRKIAFEGTHLLGCAKEIGILMLWGVVVYAIAIKVFKWE